MSKLDDLIKQFCPDGVEFMKIEDVCEISRGDVMSKTFLTENVGKYPVYSSQTVNNGELGKINTYSYDGEYLTWTTDGANAGYVFYRNEKFSVTNVCGLLKVKNNAILAKYIYYTLFVVAPKYVNKGMGNPKLMSNVMAKIQIPIPPLPVQEEIVRILDRFTALETELEARKKQYEYYQDKLLTFGDEVPMVRLGELFEFKNGLNKSKEFFGQGSPIINFTDVFKNIKLTNLNILGKVTVSENELSRFKVMKGDVFFTRTSETKEDIGVSAVLTEDIQNCVFSGFILRASPKSNLLLPDYCAYAFASFQFRKEVVSKSSFTTRALTSGTILSKIKIPIPPLEEQQRIVEILDRFDALTNDISVGLPAEINARRKQYEYYRDKLLTFKELKKENEDD